MKNFGQSFEFPIFATAGLLTHLGLSWGLVEKLLYFWPFAALSFVAPWVLGRELLGKSRWALLVAIIFAGNTALLQVSTVGHTFLAVAEVLAPLVFASFIRSMRLRSLAWALVTGLLLALQSAYEFRIMYLTVLACLAYMIVLAVTQPIWKLVGHRAVLVGVSLITLAGCESYWTFALFTYHGDYGLNLPAGPWIAFMTLFHGLAAVDPFWTWGAPSWFQTVEFSPVFFLLPLLAFLPLVARRVSPEILWLGLVALGSAFLIKQTNAPFGEIYSWMFHHVPGWNMFREASKLYFLVVIPYSILIAFWLRHMVTLEKQRPIVRRAGVFIAVVCTAATGALALASLFPLATGQLGSTTRPTNEPASFSALRTILESDRDPGSVLWFGGPWTQARPGVPDLSVPERVPLGHAFSPGSATHPVVELLGARDALTVFCKDPSVAYCYLTDQLFQYLARRVGATYIVSPTGPHIGESPTGTASETLVLKLTTILGAPQQLGNHDDGLAVWTLPGNGSPVVQAPAVALIVGTAGETNDALPALQALDLPVIYQVDPSTPSLTVGNDKTVEVIPGADGRYDLKSSGLFYLMAQSRAAKLNVAIDTLKTSMQNELTPERLPQWSVYGPVAVSAGSHVLSPSDGVTLGPLIRASLLAKSVVSGTESSQSLATTFLNSEEVVASGSTTGPAWFELRRTIDVGWRVNNGLSHLPGDSLFNLFFVATSHGPQIFSFSTHPWERLGTGFTLLWAFGIAVLAYALARRRPTRPTRQPEPDSPGGIVAPNGILASGAQNLGVVGVLLVAAGAISYTLIWLGLPLPATGPFYVSIAMAALALSCLLYSVALALSRQPGNLQAREQAQRIGSPAVGAIIEFLVRHGLWGTTKTAWDRVQRASGNTARRRHHAETFYRQFVRDGDLCFDVGANVGNRTAVFLDLGAKVVAIEPQPSCAEALRKQYGRSGRLAVVPKAAGSRPGVGELMISPANALSSMSEDWLDTVKASGRFRAFQSHSWKESITVPITTLDEMIQEFGAPAFCKIDVEGYEAEVLKGLSRPIRVLSFEFAPEFISGTQECLGILTKLGPCEFNYSVGESLQLALANWVTAHELERILTTVRDNRTFGDVYVRFLELGFFR
ncbi:MAG TPA: FkbM family methyltransferase [Candidatus Dormibacteraeota bacterium]|nr:FkbM family methyltransferase [Candidatus Dormibacteraeota bacterium]